MKLTAGCKKCGYREHAAALVWHHRDPAEKSFEVGPGAAKRSWSSLLKEIAKCDVLCANCHAITHYRPQGGLTYGARSA